jgi:hypothetical protein
MLHQSSQNLAGTSYFPQPWCKNSTKQSSGLFETFPPGDARFSLCLVEKNIERECFKFSQNGEEKKTKQFCAVSIIICGLTTVNTTAHIYNIYKGAKLYFGGIEF